MSEKIRCTYFFKDGRQCTIRDRNGHDMCSKHREQVARTKKKTVKSPKIFPDMKDKPSIASLTNKVGEAASPLWGRGSIETELLADDDEPEVEEEKELPDKIQAPQIVRDDNDSGEDADLLKLLHDAQEIRKEVKVEKLAARKSSPAKGPKTTAKASKPATTTKPSALKEPTQNDVFIKNAGRMLFLTTCSMAEGVSCSYGIDIQGFTNDMQNDDAYAAIDEIFAELQREYLGSDVSPLTRLMIIMLFKGTEAYNRNKIAKKRAEDDRKNSAVSQIDHIAKYLNANAGAPLITPGPQPAPPTPQHLPAQATVAQQIPVNHAPSMVAETEPVKMKFDANGNMIVPDFKLVQSIPRF